MPTGGVTLENFTDFFGAGASAVGMGSNLFPGYLTENNRWEELNGFFGNVTEKYFNFHHQQKQHV